MFGPGVGIGLRPVKAKQPTTEKLHEIITTVARSGIFNAFIMFIIGINAVVIGLETVEDLKVSQGHLFDILDYVFLSIYTCEFLLKFYADRSAYWKSAYNIFDFIILALSYIQILLDQLNVGDNILNVLRLLRALRTLRTISFIEGLQVLVTALIDTIRNSVLNVVILLVLLMLFFGVVGYYIFGYEETGDQARWGDLSTAMLTLFTFITADGWTDIQERLSEKYPGSQWFTVVFIFLGHFIFTNLFIGIIIMNIHEATERFLQAQRQEKEAQLKLKKEYLYKRQHDDVKQMLEKQKTSQYTNFEEMTKGFYETLRHDDYVIMTDVSVNLLWIETYLDSLDRMDEFSYRVQQTNRNLSLILGEMAERHFKKQYGLLLPDEMEDAYIPFLPKSSSNHSQSEPSSPTKHETSKEHQRSASCPSSPRVVKREDKRASSIRPASVSSNVVTQPQGKADLYVPPKEPRVSLAFTPDPERLVSHQVPTIFVVDAEPEPRFVKDRRFVESIIEEEEDEEYNDEGEGISDDEYKNGNDAV